LINEGLVKQGGKVEFDLKRAVGRSALKAGFIADLDLSSRF
jgi:hypothetical protein